MTKPEKIGIWKVFDVCCPDCEKWDTIKVNIKEEIEQALKTEREETAKKVELLKDLLTPYFSQKRLEFICEKIDKAFKGKR